MINAILDWLTTEKKVVKPLPKGPLPLGGYRPGMQGHSVSGVMVKKYTERELREQHPPLMEAWEQYQMLLELYEADNIKPFEKAKSL